MSSVKTPITTAEVVILTYFFYSFFSQGKNKVWYFKVDSHETSNIYSAMNNFKNKQIFLEFLFFIIFGAVYRCQIYYTAFQLSVQFKLPTW